MRCNLSSNLPEISANPITLPPPLACLIRRLQVLSRSIAASLILVGFTGISKAAAPGWRQVPPPQGRGGPGMAFDSGRGKTVMFGGSDVNNGRLGDTWESDGSTWTQTAQFGPSARKVRSMAYDRVRGKAVLFGGSAATTFGDTSEYGVWSNLTLLDAVSALKITAGITTATPGDIQALNLVPDAPSAASVDIPDAVSIARRVVGLDTGQ